MENVADGEGDALQPPPPAPVNANTSARSSTKRHWRVLRNALLSKTRDESSDATASSISTAFFPQFTSDYLDESTTSGVRLQHQAAANFQWHAYNIIKPNTGGGDGHTASCKRVLVHEKKKRQQVTIAELFSHKLNGGVDNTGNIRTWPSEQILLAYLLKEQTCRKLASMQESGGVLQRIRCCELGAGMAGLASLGLMAHDADHIEKMLITDGNPQSVENLKICVDENISQGVLPPSRTSAELLRWDRTTQFPQEMRHQFDVLFASDCLFFEDFHEDLAHTIKELLKPANGVCFLLQPSRNGSMERFCVVAQQKYNLQINIQLDFDPEITKKHAMYTETHASDFVPDVHLPILVQVVLPTVSG